MALGRKGWLIACLVWVVGGAVHAQSNPEDAYKNLIKVHEDVQPLGDAPFGEDINLYTGELSFHQQDIVLKGIGPDIVVQRDFTAGKYGEVGVNSISRSGEFGDWSLASPRISTLDATTTLWPSADPRCSSMAGAVPVKGPRGVQFVSSDWWNGYQLSTPDSGTQELLARGSNNGQVPTGTGINGVAPAVTAKHWVIECVGSTNNGLAGEGFLAIAPDGTKYTLNQLVYDPWYPVGKSLPGGGNGVPAGDVLNRQIASMLVTRIEDRFGNWVTYTYTGNSKQLSSIQASDGRQVNITWRTDAALISSVSIVTAGASRTWTYNYASPTDPIHVSLTSITEPDGSQWAFNLTSLSGASYSEIYQHGGSTGCTAGLTQLEPTPTFTGTMTLPSGLQGTFTTQPVQHGRSLVPNTCQNSLGVQYLQEPASYYTISLTAKAFVGASVNSAWSYQYSATNASLRDPCTTTPCAAPTCTVSQYQNCQTSVYTDVITPDGVRNRYTYSNLYGYTDGQLQRTDYNYGASPARSELFTYAPPSSGPFPDPVGSVFGTRVDVDRLQRLSPQSGITTQQDGDTYTMQVEAYDAFAQPTKVKRYNSISWQPSIEEQTTYFNDTNLWVLGQQQQLLNVSTGETERSATFNSLDLVSARFKFGEPVMTYGYDAQGDLTSFTDGNSHTTQLGSYKRGVPQSIGYADGTKESLVVDDFGQITSLTDQLGHTTSYAYDAAGRVTQVTYPYDSSVDTTSYLPNNYAYTYVGSAERGLSAGHWRRTLTRGSLVDTTYYDAYLRPILEDKSIAASAGSDISTINTYAWDGKKTFQSFPSMSAPNIGDLNEGYHYGYDGLRRESSRYIDSEKGSLVTSTSYVYGTGVITTDPNGNATTRYYQSFDSPEYDNVIQVNAPEGVSQTISRDLYGNPLQISQGGTFNGSTLSEVKYYFYDTYHRLCRFYDPEGSSTVYAYDAADNIVWLAYGQAAGSVPTGCNQGAVADAAKFSRHYDALNRLTEEAAPAGTQSSSYQYDNDGRLTTAISGIVIHGRAYNSLGNVRQETQWIPGDSNYVRTVQYGYDAYGHLSGISYPNGEYVSYATDPLDRQQRAGNYAVAQGYAADGQISGLTFGNGVSYASSENVRQLLQSISYSSAGSSLMNQSLSYDKNGSLLSINDSSFGAYSVSFSYDGLNRLLTSDAPTLGHYASTYDPLNNQRSIDVNGYQFVFNMGSSGRLSSSYVNGSPYATYVNDDGGNRISVTQGGQYVSYAYDAKNQLTHVSNGDANFYDEDGRRLKRESGGITLYSFYGPSGKILYTYNATTGASTNYIYLAGRLVARNSGGTVTYILVDRLGSPVRETDSSGNVSWTGVYTPYGELALALPRDQPGFTGHVTDSDTGLTYMLARYYDSRPGRMLSVDPVAPAPGDIFSFNRYAYASNNPVMNVDPDGRQVEAEDDETGRRAGEAGETSDAINKAQALMLLQQIRAISPGYQPPEMVGPVGGNYYNPVLTDRLSQDLTSLRQNVVKNEGVQTSPSGASLPLGSRSAQFNQPKSPSYQPLRNDPVTIDGTQYVGHAIDRMQDRGIMPSVVRNTIDVGVPSSTRGGATVYHDAENNVHAVVNAQGQVVTVSYGKPGG